jgi:hypothetical protein
MTNKETDAFMYLNYGSMKKRCYKFPVEKWRKL